MIVSLVSKNEMTSINLPQKIRGQFSISLNEKLSINIEGINEKWFLKSNKNVKILNSSKKIIANCEIVPMGIYFLALKDSTDKSFIFVEESSEERRKFTKYIINGNISLKIGRKENADIFINNKYVSGEHATLNLQDKQWSITDHNSSNGTYINGKKISQQKLECGDVIYIMGTIIIVGNRMLAINNIDSQVKISARELINFIPQQEEKTDENEYELKDEEFFYRSPRFKRDIDKAIFKIDAPPENAIGDEMPIMMTLGPALTMGMASMATATYGLMNGNMMSAVTSGCMLLGTVLWPIVSKRYEKNRKIKKEKLRQEKYKEYLDRIRASFTEECAKQREIIIENNISIDECKSRIREVKRNLWERSYGQNDFLKIRVGMGDVKLDADIQYPERRFTIERDVLQEELYTLCETPQIITDVPITLSLLEDNITGVVGNREDVLKFANGIILQLATLYSYDELKMVFLYEKNDSENLEYVKWLPHIWNNDKSFRYLANNLYETKDISAYIESEFDIRQNLRDDDLEEVEPYYVIFAFSKNLSVRAEMLNKIYDSKKNLHFSVITFFDELKNLPKECDNVVEITTEYGKIYNKKDITGKAVNFRPDIFVDNCLGELSVKLANIHLDLADSAFKLPKMITFLEMFGVGKIEHLNVTSRWKENDPTKTLAAQVGIDTLGDPFNLDLHEKFHGPHGLVAGMTGSGKSEFIMTYILSLAINYHPYEVAFILIDYKGGGMAKAFENLPHTAGIITNLDGAAVKRSLISIQSELKRRQAIFAETSKKSGISNIDIYKYQKMYREGTVSEPLQHLFIISDEFAELKTQQPEFMTQLVSAARIGRSLGVHLILATQKPSGVVDDQIWSNSRFRACLKVQDKTDSMDMLKRPEAAELQDTGRFYLQVGYNEMFKLGQSAWSGAPYYPSDRVERQVDDSIEVIDNIGRVIKSSRMDKKALFAKPRKQIDAITEYISEIATQEKIQIKPLWLDPIPEIIYVKQLKEKYNVAKENNTLNPIIGEYDDPLNQRQNILTLPLSSEGNTVIYGMAGSGKTTFLTTMLYSLVSEYSPEELNIYILDFASETLTAFEKAPQVGNVVLSYESEKINNLFKLLQGQMQSRKKLFSDYGGDILSYNENSDNNVPFIVVVINNYAAFSELYEDAESMMLNLTREGTKYGIYFVLTAIGTGTVGFRMIQNFKQVFALQLTDETDYTGVLGKTDGLVPSKFKGRGLTKKEEIYEFQTAHPFESKNQFMDIRKICLELSDTYSTKARNIPILPEVVNQKFIEPFIKEGNLHIPVGVETASLEISYFDFKKSYISMIMSESVDYNSFLSLLIKLISEKCKYETVVLDINKNIYQYPDANYMCKINEVIDMIESLFDIVLQRHNALKDADAVEKEKITYEKKVVVISSLSELKSILNEEQNEKLNLILEKGNINLGISIIIADTVSNISQYNFEKWYKINVLSGEGIWVGNGITEQYYLKVNKTTTEMTQEISTKFGFVVSKAKAVQIKLLNEETEEE